MLLLLNSNQTKEECNICMSMKICQGYVEKFGMNEAKQIHKHVEANSHLDLDTSGVVVGILLFVTTSRLDMMLSLCIYARFQVSPRESHLKATKRILKYLKHTPNVGF
jgi:hypothetical protein